tara:strand:- start:401 stop:676 length:276 start_codon:yes stop_codon:yes gene_type:complete
MSKLTLNRRLHQIKSDISLIDGSTIYNTKKIISLIVRGFTNEAICNFAREMFFNYDRPIYWELKNKGIIKKDDFFYYNQTSIGLKILGESK